MKKTFLLIVIAILMFTSYSFAQEGKEYTKAAQEPSGGINVDYWELSPKEQDILPYRIQPGDVLEVNAAGIYAIDRPFNIRVNYDGTVQFPLIGRVKLGGLTEVEAIEKLDNLLRDGYLKDPQISLIVLEQMRGTHAKQRQFSISGSVVNPGKYPVEGAMSLTDAVNVAGGLLDQGNAAEVRIIRLTEEGEKVEYIVDLEEQGLDFGVRVRDKIVVESYGTYIVYGEVENPGEYFLAKDITATRAIVAAGGFTNIASKNGVKVIRELEDAKTKIFKVPVERIFYTGDRSKDVELQDGDEVVVPESWF